MSTTNQPATDQAQLTQWLAASNQRVVVLAFVADWAGSALILRQFLERIVSDSPEVAVHYVDVDLDPQLSVDFGVNLVPSVVLLRNQTIVDMIDGVISRRKLAQRISAHQ